MEKKNLFVISFEEFNNLKEDIEDVLELRKVKKSENNKKNISLEEVKKELGL